MRSMQFLKSQESASAVWFEVLRNAPATVTHLHAFLLQQLTFMSSSSSRGMRSMQYLEVPPELIRHRRPASLISWACRSSSICKQDRQTKHSLPFMPSSFRPTCTTQCAQHSSLQPQCTDPCGATYCTVLSCAVLYCAMLCLDKAPGCGAGTSAFPV